MIDKLKSRKLWVTLAVAVAILIVEVFDVPVDLEAILAMAGLSGVYVAAQGWVDASEAKSPTTVLLASTPADDSGGEADEPDEILH